MNRLHEKSAWASRCVGCFVADEFRLFVFDLFARFLLLLVDMFVRSGDDRLFLSDDLVCSASSGRVFGWVCRIAGMHATKDCAESRKGAFADNYKNIGFIMINIDLLARTTKMTATTMEINQIDTWACFSSCFCTIASSFSSFSHFIGTLWSENGSRKYPSRSLKLWSSTYVFGLVWGQSIGTASTGYPIFRYSSRYSWRSRRGSRWFIGSRQ